MDSAVGSASALPVARFGQRDASSVAIEHEIESGSAVFCSVCSKLFRQYSDADNTRTGESRCDDCAAQARLRDVVEHNITAAEAQRRGRGSATAGNGLGTLSSLIAAPAASAPR